MEVGTNWIDKANGQEAEIVKVEEDLVWLKSDFWPSPYPCNKNMLVKKYEKEEMENKLGRLEEKGRLKLIWNDCGYAIFECR